MDLGQQYEQQGKDWLRLSDEKFAKKYSAGLKVDPREEKIHSVLVGLAMFAFVILMTIAIFSILVSTFFEF